MDGSGITAELGGVLDILERVSRTLDLMWRSAANDRSDTAVRLGEASHSLHRAIIALSVPLDPPHPRLDTTTVAG